MSAQRVKEFVQRFCKQTKSKWAGEPIRLMQWQHDIIDKVYNQSPRVIQDISIWVPRKNGKSTFIAALALYHLFLDHEGGGEIYIVSNTVNQSRNLFDTVLYMVEQFPRKLRQQFKVLPSQKRIEHPKSHSKLQILANDVEGLLGVNASVLIFDEIAFYKNRKLFTYLRQSQMSRRQPLCITISTASDNLESIGYEEHKRAKAVRDGELTIPTMLAVIHEAPPELPWDSLEAVKAANPSLGSTIDEAHILKGIEEARTEPRKRVEYETFVLNRWKGNATCWLDQVQWAACGERFDEKILLGKECWIGVDTARCFDLTAVVLLFPLDDLYYVLARYFMPQDLVQEKKRKDLFDYDIYVGSGHIVATPGDVTDYGFVRQSILADRAKYRIKEISYDPAGSTELLCNQQLGMEDGFTVVQVRPIVSKIGAASKLFEKLVIDKKLRHNNNPVLNWNSRNVSVVTDAYGNIRPQKKDGASGIAKIDGIMALITALSRMGVEDNVYNRRGPIIV